MSRPASTRYEPPASAGDERPPWIEAAADPTWWDAAFGSYGAGYLDWVHNEHFWHPADERTVADTRTLWRHRGNYLGESRAEAALLADPWLSAMATG
jgi:hypothetical protein